MATSKYILTTPNNNKKKFCRWTLQTYICLPREQQCHHWHEGGTRKQVFISVCRAGSWAAITQSLGFSYWDLPVLLTGLMSLLCLVGGSCVFWRILWWTPVRPGVVTSCQGIGILGNTLKTRPPIKVLSGGEVMTLWVLWSETLWCQVHHSLRLENQFY